MTLGKITVLGLVGALAIGALWLLSSDDPILPTLRSRAAEPPMRRGDDPTYADELKTMSALVQEMRFEMQQQARKMADERDQLSASVRSETQKAVRQSHDEIQRLQRELRDAQSTLDRKIKAALDAPLATPLQQALTELKQEQAQLRQQLSTTQDKDVASDEAEPAPLRPEANSVLTPPPARSGGEHADDLTDQLRQRIASLETKTAVPGAIQTDQTMLDRLRGLPGMGEVADRLAARAAPNASTFGPTAAAGKSTAGLAERYITLKPYIAGAGDGRRRALPNPIGGQEGQATESLIPQRYPFTVKTGKQGASAVIPVYTIPDAATLVNNSTMTPLVGRVPERGQVRDPFRFKLITGRTNLASNGHRIPGIVNAVWTGYAVGIREQSCVRAYIDTVTFTFEDTRVHTVNQGKGERDPAASVNDTLGYLTDPRGNPCIHGQYFNNAGQYLAGRSIAALIDGLAKAYSRSQVTLERSTDGVLAYIEGDVYEYAAGQGLSGATEEIADTVRERAVDAFDVVYVPPGIDVQLFVETEIPIDYDTQGRKLRYHYGQELSHATLD